MVTLFTSPPDLSVVFSLFCLFVFVVCLVLFHSLLLPFWRIKMYITALFLFSGIIADNFADEVILEPTEIAKHYLKTFFFLDLISSLPLDYILLSVSPEASVNQLVHAGWLYSSSILSCSCSSMRSVRIYLKRDRNDPNDRCSQQPISDLSKTLIILSNLSSSSPTLP